MNYVYSLQLILTVVLLGLVCSAVWAKDWSLFVVCMLLIIVTSYGLVFDGVEYLKRKGTKMPNKSEKKTN